MKNFKFLKKISFLVSLAVINVGHAADFFSMQDLSYVGATRFIDVVAGESRLGYANGTFLVNEQRDSIFIVGHEQHQAVAEYKLDGFLNSSKMEELPMAKPTLQEYSKILNRASEGNPEKIDVITGMAMIDGKLVLNAAKFYDAGASNEDTTLIIRDFKNIRTSLIDGYFEIEAKNHAAGWMTPVPESLRQVLEADYIFGNASNLPINSRNSMGPSAFGVSSESLSFSDSRDLIPTETLLDFSINNQLHEDHYNEMGDNDLWTEISKAFVGFIVPGTRTYAVFGSSAGHFYGIGYKIEQDTGNTCGGACSKVASDRYNYYWLWNIDDLLAVKRGEMEPYEPKPYEYGRFELPFEGVDSVRGPHLMTAAYYDYENQNVYFMLGGADRLQSQYETLPILLKYKIVVGIKPSPPADIKVN